MQWSRPAIEGGPTRRMYGRPESRIKVTYSEEEKQFTLKGSRNLPDDAVEGLLVSVGASRWYPISAGRDSQGDA